MLSLFADDTRIYGTDPLTLQSTLDEMCVWLDNRQLNLAVHKYFCLNISGSKNDTIPLLSQWLQCCFQICYKRPWAQYI